MDTIDTGAEKAAVDLLPDGVVIADADGRVVLANVAAHKLLAAEDLVGRRLEQAIALQDQDGNDWFTANAPYAGLNSRSGLTEQSWFLADGTELLITGRLHRAARGKPVEQVALALRSARGRFQLDRERSDLVATVAHELRSPLTGVKGFVSTLLTKWDRLNDEQKKLMLTTVHADSERLSRLIAELLDVARIDTGRLPLYPREVETVPAIDRVIDSVRAGTGRTIVHEHAEVPPIFADPDKLVQVLTNLVDNAVRHGEGVVRVTSSPTGSPFPGVLITVDDEGEGIEEGIRTRVFTKFWKHGTRGGSGLGMYIVNGLVRVHGGELEIGDAPGGGARILVRWPSEDRRTT